MKKRGFALIEVVASMAILSILLVISFSEIKYYEKHIERIQNISTIYSLKDFLSFSKKYCYENEKTGELYFDNCDYLSKVDLISEGKIIKTLDIDKKFKLDNSNYVTDNKRFVLLNINKDGYLEPYTLMLIDENFISKKIVIQVGGNLIYIKDE